MYTVKFQLLKNNEIIQESKAISNLNFYQILNILEKLELLIGYMQKILTVSYEIESVKIWKVVEYSTIWTLPNTKV